MTPAEQERWLRRLLAGAPGRWMPCADVTSAGRVVGIRDRAIRRVAERVGVVKVPGASFGLVPAASVFWLPERPGDNRHAPAFNLQSVQAVYDVTWRVSGGCGAWQHGMPGTPRQHARDAARRVQIELERALVIAGVPVPVPQSEDHAPPLWWVAVEIARGNRPKALERHYPAASAC